MIKFLLFTFILFSTTVDAKTTSIIDDVLVFNNSDGIYTLEQRQTLTNEQCELEVSICKYSYVDNDFSEKKKWLHSNSERNKYFDFRKNNDKWYLLSEVEFTDIETGFIKTIFRIQVFNNNFQIISDFSFEGRAGKRLSFNQYGQIQIINGFIEQVNDLKISMGKQLLTLNDFGDLISQSVLPNNMFNCSTPNEWMYIFQGKGLCTISNQENCLNGFRADSYSLKKSSLFNSKMVVLSGTKDIYNFESNNEKVIVFSANIDSTKYKQDGFGGFKYGVKYNLSIYDTLLNRSCSIDLGNSFINELTGNYMSSSITNFDSKFYVNIGNTLFFINENINKLEPIYTCPKGKFLKSILSDGKIYSIIKMKSNNKEKVLVEMKKNLQNLGTVPK